MNIYYKLRAQGKQNPKIILHVFDGRFKGRKFMYSTGRSIDITYWDKRKGRPKLAAGQAYENELKSVNDFLNQLEEVVIKFFSQRFSSKTLSREELKKEIEINIKGTEVKANVESPDMFIIWEELIKTTKNPKTGTPITDGTKRSKKQTLELLKKFFAKKKITPDFKSFDISFYHDFDDYMVVKGLNENSRGKNFKEIKAILR
jgi:hypothetical protein